MILLNQYHLTLFRIFYSDKQIPNKQVLNYSQFDQNIVNIYDYKMLCRCLLLERSHSAKYIMSTNLYLTFIFVCVKLEFIHVKRAKQNTMQYDNVALVLNYLAHRVKLLNQLTYALLEWEKTIIIYTRLLLKYFATLRCQLGGNIF